MQEHALRAAPPVEVLPLAVCAEEAEHRHREAVLVLVGQCHVLVEQLRHGVRPPAARARAEDEIAVLSKRQVVALAVHVRRRCEDELRALLHAQVECVLRALDVRCDEGQRVAVARDLRGGEVQHRIDVAGTCGEQGCAVEDVELHE